MVRIITLLLLLLIMPFANSHALAFTDVPAQAQRLALLAEERVQSLKLVIMAKDMYNNYVTARQTYELAKAGIERTRDPKEWEALEEYSRLRLKRLSEADPNPYSSSLYKNMVAMGRVADEYVMNTHTYKAIQDTIRNSSGKLSGADEASNKWLMKDTPIGAWYGIETSANQQADTMAAARTYIETAYQSGEHLGGQVAALQAEGVEAVEEFDHLQKLQFYAEQGYAFALERVKNTNANAAGMKAAEANLEKAKALLDDIRQRLKDKEEYIREVDGRVTALKHEIVHHNNNLSVSGTAMGLEEIAKRTVTNSGLVKMGEKESLIEGFQQAGWWLLVIATMIGFLWRSTAVLRGDDSENVLPKDTIASLIIAFVFLAPGSPVSVKTLAKEGAVFIDAAEMTLFKNTTKDFQTQLGQGLSLLGTVDASVLESSKSASLLSQASVVAANVSKPMTFLVMQMVFIVSSLIGTLATIIVFSARTVIYWVLMAILPLILFLLPIPHVRQKMMPTWGTMMFAVILWGPVSKILLTFNSILGQMNESLIGGFIGGNALSASMVYGVQGLILLVLVILSPMLSYYLSLNSLGAVSSAVVSGGGMALSGATTSGLKALSFATTGGGSMLMAAGNKFGDNSIGTSLLNAGKLMKSMGETIGRTRMDTSRGSFYLQKPNVDRSNKMQHRNQGESESNGSESRGNKKNYSYGNSGRGKN